MSQQNKLMGTPNTADLPVKRKRGRPRKDENLVKKEHSQLPAAPASDSIEKIQQAEVNQINDVDDNMVGRVVSGVIEGTFDAGYFLCVRIGNSSTLLRGVVFLPEQVAPITAANDVAPHSQLYKRKDVPIPVFDPQSPVNSSILRQVRDSEQPVQLENQAPVAPDQVFPPELQSGAPFALNNQSASVMPLTNMPMNAAGASLAGKITPQQKPEFGFVNQSASVIVPLTNTSKNDAGTSLGGGKVMQQQIPEFRFENQSASSIVPLPNLPNNVSSASQEVGKVTHQHKLEFGFENQSPSLLKNLKMVEQDEVMQVFEVPASEPMVGIFSCGKTTNQVPQVQIQACESELVLDQTPVAETQFLLPEPQKAEPGPSPTESVHNELRSSNIELHHTPVVTESQLVPVESQYVDSGLKSSEFVHKKLDSSNVELNQTLLVPEPLSEPMDIVTERPISPKNDNSRFMQPEKDSSKDDASENGDPVNDGADNTAYTKDRRGNQSRLNQPAEESGFPGRTESRISNSSGHTTDIYFVLGDAIPPTQSHC